MNALHRKKKMSKLEKLHTSGLIGSLDDSGTTSTNYKQPESPQNVGFLAHVSRLMGPRQFFTPPELVKMGIYGSKSSVWRAVHLGHIEAFQVSDRRWVILKDSILKHIENRKMDKREELPSNES